MNAHSAPNTAGEQRDELIHDMLCSLAGLDTYDVNLRDNPQAYVIVDTMLAALITGEKNTQVKETEDQLRADFEHQSNLAAAWGFKRSRKGTYVNPAIARDWKWFRLGAAALTREQEARCNCGPTCEDKRDGCRYTREQEAQPADDGLREDIQPINTGPKKPADVGRRAAQPAPDTKYGTEQYMRGFNDATAQARAAQPAAQEPSMRHILMTQIWWLIDLAEQYARLMHKRGDTDERDRIQGAIDHARKAVEPYTYNGPDRAAQPPSAPQV